LIILAPQVGLEPTTLRLTEAQRRLPAHHPPLVTECYDPLQPATDKGFMPAVICTVLLLGITRNEGFSLGVPTKVPTVSQGGHVMRQEVAVTVSSRVRYHPIHSHADAIILAGMGPISGFRMGPENGNFLIFERGSGYADL